MLDLAKKATGRGFRPKFLESDDILKPRSSVPLTQDERESFLRDLDSVPIK